MKLIVENFILFESYFPGGFHGKFSYVTQSTLNACLSIDHVAMVLYAVQHFTVEWWNILTFKNTSLQLIKVMMILRKMAFGKFIKTISLHSFYFVYIYIFSSTQKRRKAVEVSLENILLSCLKQTNQFFFLVMMVYGVCL